MSILAMLARALDLLVPPDCAACGLPGAAICAACEAALAPLSEPRCGGCGHPASMAVPRCPDCPAGPIVGARQAVAYLGPAPRLVAALKDGRRRRLAELLAELIAARVPPPTLGVALVPVPLGSRRLAERGFNQSRLIADALGRRWRRPVVDVLVRVREEGAQRGAAAGERVRQVAGAFAMRPSVRAPRHVCLVDDVHTTGATLSACARVLARGGAEPARAVAFARVLRP